MCEQICICGQPKSAHISDHYGRRSSSACHHFIEQGTEYKCPHMDMKACPRIAELEAQRVTLCNAVRELAKHARWTTGTYVIWKHQEAIAMAEEKTCV